MQEFKIIPFRTEMKGFIAFANLLVACTFLVAISFAVVQGIFFMRPRVSWWNIMDLGPKREYLEWISLTYEVVWKTGLFGFVLLIPTSMLNFVWLLRGKLRWQAVLTWTCINLGLLCLAGFGFLSWDGVTP